MTGLVVRIRRKTFPAVGDAAARTVLDDFRLEVPAGQFCALVGPSGCGKTTLLNIVAGIDRRFEGSVQLPGSAAGGAARIGYMFQNPRLLPWRTVRENIALVRPPGPDPTDQVGRWLGMVGLDGQEDVYPPRLSVGMSRRVALARAFAVEPELLLMDEPFVSLDQTTAQRLRRLLVTIWQQRPTTVLLVTHDLREAVTLADRIVFLSHGPARILADVPVELPRSRRWDEMSVETWRRRLIDNPPAALEGLE